MHRRRLDMDRRASRHRHSDTTLPHTAVNRRHTMTPPHPLDALTPGERAQIDALPSLERARALLAQKKFEVSRARRRAAQTRLVPSTQTRLTTQAADLNAEILGLAISDDALQAAAADPQFATRLARAQTRSRAAVRAFRETRPAPSGSPGKPPVPYSLDGACPGPPVCGPHPPRTAARMVHVSPETFTKRVQLRRRRDVIRKRQQQTER